MARARAVIIENGKVLALERNKTDDRFWCFPGGEIEKGESAKEALERECLEEVNVGITVGKKIHRQDFEGQQVDFYLGRIVKGKVSRGSGPEYLQQDRTNSYRPVWLPIKDLDKYDLRPNGLRDKVHTNTDAYTKKI